MRLDGRVAIVTGGNSGIGRGVAEAMAAAGAGVVVAGRDKTRNAEVVEAITSAGGKAVAISGDMTREADVKRLVPKALDTFGRLDVCVANAGGTADVGTAPLAEFGTDMWRSVMALNLDAAFYLYRDAVRHMLEAGHGGSLIGMSSVASIRSVGPAPHYSAAKAGLNQLSTVLAEQLGPHGIRINTIVPGFVKSNTPTNIAIRSDPKLYEGMMKRVPMRRMGEPADVAALAVFLASDLSSFITGQSIVIDGGQTTRMVIDPPAE
jgi:NAD(P)-dependent dehydrogenase (short-subunit alcohol dehydrogenase family)